MAWVKLDDRFFQHPKVIQISNAAFRLYINGLCYSSLYQTDGKLLKGVCSNLLASFYQPAMDEWTPDECIEELLKANLWDSGDDHYMIHDYLEYNLSKENREKLSELRKESGSKGGIAKAKQVARLLLQQRRSKTLADPKPIPISQTQTETPSQTEKQKTRQLPSSRALPESVEWGSSYCLMLKYNKESPGNVPTVKSPSKNRVVREMEYLRMFPDENWWTQTFLQYHRSRFLSGQTTPGNGHGNFKPDFDWLLSKGKDGIENCVKVHDGRYRDG